MHGLPNLKIKPGVFRISVAGMAFNISFFLMLTHVCLQDKRGDNTQQKLSIIFIE